MLEKGRIIRVGSRVVFGTMAAVGMALGSSKVSRAINAAFVEREDRTDRHRNARKARRTFRFCKDWRCHEAATYLSLFSYNSAGRFGPWPSGMSEAIGSGEARR